MTKSITYLHVRAISACASRGRLQIGHLTFACFLGKNGRTGRKSEGDMKSPSGSWRLGKLHFRADRAHRFRCALPAKPLRKNDGWCDAVGDRNYNRKLALPYAASYEMLWRQDLAYDLVVTTSHNVRPRLQGAGSAIFLHIIAPGSEFTAGCIALKAGDLRRVLALCSRHTYLVI